MSLTEILVAVLGGLTALGGAFGGGYAWGASRGYRRGYLHGFDDGKAMQRAFDARAREELVEQTKTQLAAFDLTRDEIGETLDDEAQRWMDRSRFF